MKYSFDNYKIGEIYDISSGLSKDRSFFGKGNPFLSFKTVFNNYFVPNELLDLVETSSVEVNKYSIKKGDVFLTRTSETQNELGMSCVALKDYPKATFNGFTKRLRLKHEWLEKVDDIFIGYYFRSDLFRKNVTAMSSLTTRASLNNEMINRLPIYLPNIVIQKKIGVVLAYIDEKIKLNNKINDNLCC